MSDEHAVAGAEDAPETAEGAGVSDGPERPLPENPVLRDVLSQFEGAEWRLSTGQDTVIVPKEQHRRFAEAARSAGYEMLTDLTAVDHLRRRPVRFEVVVGLLSMQHNTRVRVRVAVDGDDPCLPSLVPVYPAANFFEREAYDMFGIEFEDHPDMTRILMPDDWEGHPLRKDFGTGAVPVQFKSSPQVT